MNIERVIVDPLYEEKLSSQFLIRAREAYRADELKICIVYLRKVKDWDLESIGMLVDSAYRMWSHNREVGGDDEDVQATIESAFTVLLNGSVPFDLISSNDYIRLTHIYICEGNLNGAFQILTLATARGHLESVPIVLQMWTLLTRLDREKDSTDCISFLVSAVTLESAKTKAEVKAVTADNTLGETRKWSCLPMLHDCGIPLYFVFLHCINHLMNKTLNTPPNSAHRVRIMKELHGLLVECYFLFCGEKMDHLTHLLAWFNDWGLWMDMANTCKGSCFLLLGEDSLWEAFRRQPLADLPLQLLVDSMTLYHRRSEAPAMLAKAIMLSPWNSFCRQQLQLLEQEAENDPKSRRWCILFTNESNELTKVQGVIRGHRLRKYWPDIRAFRQKVCADFAAKVAVADSQHAAYWAQVVATLCNRWVRYVRYTVWLKHTSATRIQAWVRKTLAVWRLRTLRRHVRETNGKFLPAKNTIFNLQRIAALHFWYDRYMHNKKVRAASVLSDVIWLAGYNQYLVKGMNAIMRVLRVRFKHVKARWLAHWVRRFAARRCKHAVVTIRFFVRGVYRRIAERAQEQALQAVESVVAEQQEVMFLAKHLSVKRDMWQRWRKKYLMIVSEKAVLRMVVVLQHAFLRKKAARALLQRRARLECQRAYLTRLDFLQKLRIFSVWRKFHAVHHIQRTGRIFIAKKKLKRLQIIDAEVGKRVSLANYTLKRIYFVKCIKFVRLARSERLQALATIVVALRRHAFYCRIRRVCLRRMRCVAWVRFLDLFVLRHCFRWFQQTYLCATKFKGAIQVFRTMERGKLMQVFEALLQRTREQGVLRALEQQAERRVDRQHWVLAHKSVRILSLTEEALRLERGGGPNADKGGQLAAWEVSVPAQKYLLTIPRLHVAAAFRAWMATYRVAQHCRRGSAGEAAERVLRDVIASLAARRHAAQFLQPHARRVLAVTRTQRMIQKQRCWEEYRALKLARFQQKVVVTMLRITARRRAGRLRLQRAARVFLAHLEVHRRRAAYRALCQHECELDCSEMQRWLCRKVIITWQCRFVQSMATRIFTETPEAFEQYLERLQRRRHHRRDDRGQGEVDIEEEDEEDPAARRWRQIEAYQKQLATPTPPPPGKAEVTRHKLVSNRIVSRRAGALPRGPLAAFPSSSSMFFQSDAFHRVFAHIRAAHICVLTTAVCAQLQLPELQYCLFHAQCVLLHEPTQDTLRLVCLYFRGAKVVLSSGGLPYGAVLAYLSDLCTDRALLGSASVDSAKWPLTLPTMASTPAMPSAGLAVVLQSVSLDLPSTCLLAQRIWRHGELRARQQRMAQYEPGGEGSAPASEALVLTSLAVDVDSLGWTATALLLRCLLPSPLVALTIDHNADSVVVPQCVEDALGALALHPRLQVLVLRGPFPVSVYYCLAGLLQAPTHFPQLHRLELQQGAQRQRQGQQEEDRGELERVTAVELLVHLAKMRAYSSTMVGLSVQSDLV